MKAEQANALAEKAELIRQLCMSQLPTAQMANLTLHGLLRDVVMKSMELRDELRALAAPVAQPEKKPEEKPKKKPGRPKKEA